MSRTPRPAGFTLTELLFALAVMAVLTAIAIPAYQGTLRKARRSDAIAEVSKIQQAQERMRGRSMSYSVDLGSSATGLKLVPGTTAVDHYVSAGGHYDISVSDAGPNAYTVTARAKASSSQAGDAPCQCLRLAWNNGSGVYSAASMSGAGCGAFDATHAARCWRR
jgi:type IV pilus assembly protein PilE